MNKSKKLLPLGRIVYLEEGNFYAGTRLEIENRKVDNNHSFLLK